MQVTPLIRSRTFLCDFNSDFIVRPEDLDIAWAREKVLATMETVENLNGVRRLVASNGKDCIAGISCKLKFFIETYLQDKIEEAKGYFADDGGRNIIVFIGYSFKGDGTEIPSVPYEKLWQWLKDYFDANWKRKVPPAVSFPDEYCETEPVNTAGMRQPDILESGVEIYTTTSDDEKLFKQCLSKAQTQRLIFCSNVKESIVRRLKQSEKKTPAAPPKKPEAAVRSPRQQKPAEPERQTNRKLILAVAAIVIVILLVLSRL